MSDVKQISTGTWRDESEALKPYTIRWNYKGDVWVDNIAGYGIGSFSVSDASASDVIDLLQFKDHEVSRLQAIIQEIREIAIYRNDGNEIVALCDNVLGDSDQ